MKAFANAKPLFTRAVVYMESFCYAEPYLASAVAIKQLLTLVIAVLTLVIALLTFIAADEVSRYAKPS